MSKKTNTLLFILGGTVLNIIVTVLSFLVLMLVYSRLIHPILPENAVAWSLPIIFLLSIIASFLIYRLVIKIVFKKVDMEKYFDPIFGSRRPGKKP